LSKTDIYSQGIAYPALSDAPDAETGFDTQTNGIVQRTTLRFASASARAAALTGASAPVEGMVTWLQDADRLEVYDGAAWQALAHGSTSWTTPTLAASYSGDGNSNGTVQYRLTSRFGTNYVEWRGGLNIPYSGSNPLNSGNFLSAALASTFRPASRRTVTVACSDAASTRVALKVDFHTDGTVTIVGTTSNDTPPWLSLNNVQYSL
jgi:hypothetical protein